MIILNADEKVKTFIKDCFDKILNDRRILEALEGNLFWENKSMRFEEMIRKIKLVAGGDE
jgi:hypothetical protein